MPIEPALYQQAKGIFFAALDLPSAQREPFIEDSCGPDLELRAVLHRLIEAHDSSESFLSDPAVSPRERAGDVNQPRFQPGMLLAGRFRILRFISAGGMGEVYEAEDLELHERVALKTIRSGIAGNERVLALFKHEIQLARRVTHPNVCRIFDLSRHSDAHPDRPEQAVHFLSMELLDGQSLSQYLKENGPFSAAGAMPLIEQMAAALQAAHDAGVIHRDFKPGNVMLVPREPEGGLRVVVTDFGLALPSTGNRGGGGGEAGPRGGTPGYMAPEQSGGGMITAATDVYSFGTVIAEMIGGKRSEQRKSLLSTWRSHSETCPPVSLRLPDSCAGWKQALERCVELLPERRFQKPVEVVAALRATDPRKARLRWLRRPAPTERRSKGFAPTRRWWMAALLASLGIPAAAMIVFWWRSAVPPPTVTQTVQLTDDHHQKWFRLAADDARIYFSEREKDRWFPVAVSTRGGEPVEIPTPFQNAIVQDISPKGTELLITSSEQPLWEPLSRENPLWVISTEGAKPYRLGELEVSEARWSPDGKGLLFIRENRVYVGKSDGTGSRMLVSMPSRPYFPSWSPDGERLSLSVADPQTGRPALWELNADGSNLHSPLTGWGDPFDCSGSWTRDGRYLLFDSFRGGPDGIWAVRERRSWLGKRRGEPVRLSSGPISSGKPVASKDGRRIFFLGNTSERSGRLSRYDAKSRDWNPILSGISAEHVDFSRDGQWVAYTSILGANLSRSKIDGSQRLQLTSPPMQAASPRWSPDGKKIAFMARLPNGPWKIHIVPAGGGVPQPVLTGRYSDWYPDWLPDGNSLILNRNMSPEEESAKLPSVCIVDVRTKRITPIPGSWGADCPRLSPDARYLAVNFVGKVMLFDFRSRQWETLAEGGDFYFPSWSRDSRYVYFIDWRIAPGAYDRVGIRDHKRERVAQLDRVYVHGIFGGAWVGLTPDGAPLTSIRDAETEIFAFDWSAP